MLGKLLQSTHQPVWRLVKDHCPWLRSQFPETGLTPLLHREETFETESVARKAGRDHCRNQCRRPGECTDFYPGFGAGPHKEETRIGNARRTGITDQSHVQTGENTLLEELHRPVFIELVVGLHSDVYIVVLHEH